ncbi:DNA cytosine methyltransferase [Mesorhizobium sp. M1B.F.Ca.ET.045.04.1.1]|uniref:DNA cytosine methyltransferase n=1 Tax=Mesorhizobium sp. M1B.F.Ca.ET.045.04.1.1 TaxID=2493673 RepID=UPI001AED0E33|nr:DNA cytosine methyltransferase [Mesorhizobium sp. M1B.F.Ca.ET.045.04.1.1]
MAWHSLGWTPAFFSEIEKFPSAVLAHHYGSNMPGEPLATNGVPNHGDFTKISADAGPIDLLVGGTPCQSFSVAGKRLGLDDPRGNLALEFLSLARRLGARWIVWENVPGVLSSFSGGEQANREVQEGPVGGEGEGIEERDLAMFLSFVRECGYGFAYRVLDSQFVRVDGYSRAVPQRRRRLFVVGYLGDWRRAAAVLFESESMRRDSPPRRQSGQRVAPTIASRSTGGGGLGTDFDIDGGQTAVCSQAAFGGGNTSDQPRGGDAALAAHNHRIDFEVETFVVSDHAGYRRAGAPSLRAASGDVGHGSEALVTEPVYAIQERAVSENPDAGPQGKGYQEDIAYTLEARNKVQGVDHALPAALEQRVVHSLRGEGFDASEDGTGRGTPIIAVSVAPTLRAGGNKTGGDRPYRTDVDTCESLVPIAFSMRGRDGGATPEVEHGGVAPVVRTPGGGSSQTFVAFAQNQREEVRLLEAAGRLPATRRGDAKNETIIAESPSVISFNARQDPINEQDLSLPIDADGTTIGVTDGGWRVRRLTPLECERLQGFPDRFTQIPNWDGWRDVGEDEDIGELKAADLTVRKTKKGYRVNDPDGVRYKALGNSMACNVMRWIGQRIDRFERLVAEGKISR